MDIVGLKTVVSMKDEEINIIAPTSPHTINKEQCDSNQSPVSWRYSLAIGQLNGGRLDIFPPYHQVPGGEYIVKVKVYRLDRGEHNADKHTIHSPCSENRLQALQATDTTRYKHSQCTVELYLH